MISAAKTNRKTMDLSLLLGILFAAFAVMAIAGTGLARCTGGQVIGYALIVPMLGAIAAAPVGGAILWLFSRFGILNVWTFALSVALAALLPAIVFVRHAAELRRKNEAWRKNPRMPRGGYPNFSRGGDRPPRFQATVRVFVPRVIPPA